MPHIPLWSSTVLLWKYWLLCSALSTLSQRERRSGCFHHVSSEYCTEEIQVNSVTVIFPLDKKKRKESKLWMMLPFYRTQTSCNRRLYFTAASHTHQFLTADFGEILFLLTIDPTIRFCLFWVDQTYRAENNSSQELETKCGFIHSLK